MSGILRAHVFIGDHMPRVAKRACECVKTTDFVGAKQGIPTYDVNLFVASAGDTDAIVKSYPSREWKKHRNIAYWAEELDVFPSDWLQHMNHFDEIWTASDFVTMSIRNSPANAGTPVVTMPLGIDIDLSIYAKARGRFKIPEGTLVFLVMFNSAHQLRNPLAVLAAFRAFQADSGSSNVLLVMKCVRPEGDVTEFQQLEREVNRTNNALLMTDALSRQELCSLMASVDVFVSLHTSASSGLALLQCGLALLRKNAISLYNIYNSISHLRSCPFLGGTRLDPPRNPGQDPWPNETQIQRDLILPGIRVKIPGPTRPRFSW